MVKLRLALKKMMNVAVRLTDGKQDILLGTAHASLIRFPENSLRPLGRTASGVRGILREMT